MVGGIARLQSSDLCYISNPQDRTDSYSRHISLPRQLRAYKVSNIRRDLTKLRKDKAAEILAKDAIVRDRNKPIPSWAFVGRKRMEDYIQLAGHSLRSNFQPSRRAASRRARFRISKASHCSNNKSQRRIGFVRNHDHGENN